MSRWAGVMAAIGMAVLMGCSPGDAVDSALLLRDLGNPAAGDEVARKVIAWESGLTTFEADLYSIGDGDAAAGIVLVPGLAREGRTDKRLVGLAQALARRNFAVLVPELPGFRQQRVSAGDSAPIEAAVRQLRTRLGPERVVGVAAVSYAVGPAVLAALSPDPAAQADFILALGGYYDSYAVTTFFTTGFFRAGPGRPWQHAVPNEFGKWVFVGANAERISDPSDRTSLMAVARRKLADLRANVDDLIVELGPEGRAVLALLNNRDPERVPELIRALPPPIRAELDALDLRRQNLAPIAGRVILIHGRDDHIIPYTESQALAAALRPGQAHLALLDNLAHADLGVIGLGDTVRLWMGAYAVMQQRRALPQRAEAPEPLEVP
jgi:pimeloyl-ACP methyl ester carboxylesterase